MHCGKTKHGSEKRFSDMKSTGNLPQDQVVSKAIQILNRAKDVPGVPPLLNFENFEAALLGSRSTQDDKTLHANFRGRVYKSAIG